MKWSTIIFVVLILALSIPATLYFVHPRIIERTTFIESLPDVVTINFKPAKPDTTINMGANLLSKKTFRQHLLGLDVESKIDVWAKCPVDSIGNHIELSPNKAELSKIFQDDIDRATRAGKSSGLKTGLIIGGVSVGVAATTIYLLAKK